MPPRSPSRATVHCSPPPGASTSAAATSISPHSCGAPTAGRWPPPINWCTSRTEPGIATGRSGYAPTMQWFTAPGYWFAREVFQRGLAVVYLIAFVGAARQFRALIGADGMLPVPAFLARSSFRGSPSLFHLHYSDRFFAGVAWAGAALAAALAAGADDRVPLWAAMLLWFAAWVLYLS